MEEQATQSLKQRFHAALSGSIVVALCCFTPVLVILFAAIGLSSFTPYLDYVLFPALAALIIMTIYSYKKWKKLQNRT